MKNTILTLACLTTLAGTVNAQTFTAITPADVGITTTGFHGVGSSFDVSNAVGLATGTRTLSITAGGIYVHNLNPSGDLNWSLTRENIGGNGNIRWTLNAPSLIGQSQGAFYGVDEFHSYSSNGSIVTNDTSGNFALTNTTIDNIAGASVVYDNSNSAINPSILADAPGLGELWMSNPDQATWVANVTDGQAAGANSYSLFLEVENVPEPSSTALLGLGGLALILRRRK